MTLPIDRPLRRAFTTTELTAIIDRIDAADSTGDLLAAAISGVYDTLLADTGLTLTTLPDDRRIDPRQFQIPASQWEAICGAVTDRAAAWGTGPDIALELANVMPGSYNDPAAPTPDRPRTDRRPDLLHLMVSRDAVDVIAAATHHIQALAAHFGPASEEHQTAAGSWLAALAQLLSLGYGGDTHVHRDDTLSLLVTTSSGFTYGLIFHGATRRCIAGDGCTAVIGDDGTLSRSWSSAVVAEHIHRPSFPLDAPRPGSWSLHS
jgi:hypothetical protein